MVEPVCKSCGLSAVCLGEGGLEELISKMVFEYMDKFESSGPPPKTEYEKEAIHNVAATQAANRVKELLESRLPEQCPILRRHHANSEGVRVGWYGADTDAEVPDD